MSPELLDPDRSGFASNQPTKKSDCYALGMVVLEVLSGRAPFTPFRDFTVVRKVLEGEHPGRPEGAEGMWFTDDLWEMLEQCWSHHPERRPNIEAVLECLERVSAAHHPPSLMVDGSVQIDSAGNHTCMFPHFVTIPRLTFEGKVAGSSVKPSRSLTVLPTVGSLLQGSSHTIAAGSTDASEASRPSQPSEKLDPEESAGIVDQVSWTCPPDEFRYQPVVPLGST